MGEVGAVPEGDVVGVGAMGANVPPSSAHAGFTPPIRQHSADAPNPNLYVFMYPLYLKIALVGAALDTLINGKRVADRILF